MLLPHVLAATDPDRRVDEVTEERWWLLDRAGSYRQARGEPQAALPLLRRAYSSGRARLGDDHPDTLGSANNLALVLYALGEYQQARDSKGGHPQPAPADNRRRPPPTPSPRPGNLARNFYARLGQHQQADALGNQITSSRARSQDRVCPE